MPSKTRERKEKNQAKAKGQEEEAKRMDETVEPEAKTESKEKTKAEYEEAKPDSESEDEPTPEREEAQTLLTEESKKNDNSSCGFGTIMWSLTVMVACSFVVLIGSGYVFNTTQNSPNRCTMTYMYPTYTDMHLKSLPRDYKLYKYTDGGVPNCRNPNPVTPVLFVPGNSGSYKQVRSVGRVALEMAGTHSNLGCVAVYALDFNEEKVALHAGSIYAQINATSLSIDYIRSIHDNAPVVLIGHSMGGCVASYAAFGTRSDRAAGRKRIAGIITLSSPLVVPPFTHEPELNTFYNALHDAFGFATLIPSNNRPFVVSLTGGQRDSLVAARTCDLGAAGGVINTNNLGITVHTASVPGVWLDTDHQCIVWCREVVETVSDIIQVFVGKHDAEKTKNLIRNRLVATLPDMLINEIIPHTQSFDTTGMKTTTTLDAATLPNRVNHAHGLSFLDLNKIRERNTGNIMLRAKVTKPLERTIPLPLVLVCGESEMACNNISSSWTSLKSTSDDGAPAYTHFMWLSRAALRPYQRLYVNALDDKDVILVQAFSDPQEATIPSPSDLTTLVNSVQRLAAPDRVLHLSALIWRHDRPLSLTIESGSGPHIVIAVHTPSSISKHKPEISAIGTLDGKSNESITISSTFDPRGLDVFIIPTSSSHAGAVNLKQRPLKVTIRLNVEALLGNLFRDNWINAFAFAMALTLLAYTGVVLKHQYFLASLCQQFPIVTLAVFAISIAFPKVGFTPEQAIFLCVAGAADAFAFYIFAIVLSLIPVGVSALVGMILPIKRAESFSMILSTIYSIVLPVVFALFGPFVSLGSSLLALILRMTTADSHLMRITFKRLMPFITVVTVALCYSSGSLLDGKPEMMKFSPMETIMSDYLGLASAAIAAIVLAIRSGYQFSRSIRLLQCFVLVLAAVFCIIFGYGRVYASVTIAITAFIFA